jgi:NAD(P)H dehydrogenase (quinone)
MSRETSGHVTKDDFMTSDGIIAGSPVYFGTMAAEIKTVFKKFIGVRKKMGDKIGAAFTTSGDSSGGKETTIMSIIQAFFDLRDDYRRRPSRCNGTLWGILYWIT